LKIWIRSFLLAIISIPIGVLGVYASFGIAHGSGSVLIPFLSPGLLVLSLLYDMEAGPLKVGLIFLGQYIGYVLFFALLHYLWLVWKKFVEFRQNR